MGPFDLLLDEELWPIGHNSSMHHGLWNNNNISCTFTHNCIIYLILFNYMTFWMFEVNEKGNKVASCDFILRKFKETRHQVGQAPAPQDAGAIQFGTAEWDKLTALESNRWHAFLFQPEQQFRDHLRL